MNDSNMTIKKEKENIYIKRIKELISQYETGIIRKSLIFFYHKIIEKQKYYYYQNVPKSFLIHI